MSLGSFVDYVPVEGVLRPAVIVHRNRSAVAVPLDLAFIFSGGSAEEDVTAMAKCIEYAAVLFGGTFIKNDVLKIHDLICQQMNAAIFTPPSPEPLLDMSRLTERMGLKLSINGEELVNAA